MNLTFKLGKQKFDFQKTPTFLVCGETGSGKSTLILDIYRQLSKQNQNKVKFVFIDLKNIEYKFIKDKNALFPTCFDVDCTDKIIDDLINNEYDSPIVVFWDVFEDYIHQVDGGLEKFKSFVSQIPKKNIYLVTCSSVVPYGNKYVDKFSGIFLGRWTKDSVESVFPEALFNKIKANHFDYESLNTGEFLFLELKIGKNKKEIERLEDEMAERLARIMLIQIGAIPDETGNWYGKRKKL
jgi:ABC-type dipeptide/oligopeptide/nickel transport system ATPase component